MSFESGRLSVLAGATTASNVGTYSIQVQLKNDLGAASSQLIKIVINAVPVATTDDSSTAASTATSQTNTTADSGTGQSAQTTSNTVIQAPSAESSAAMSTASESVKQTFSALTSAPALVLKGGGTFNWADAFAKTQKKSKDP